MSNSSINGFGPSLGYLLGGLSKRGATQNTAAPTQSTDATGSDTSTHESEKSHGHHHHDHGGGKQLFKQIQSAVTSALQALPADGTADPHQAIIAAITQVLKGDGITLPGSGTPSAPDTPAPTDPSSTSETQPAADAPPPTDTPPSTDTPPLPPTPPATGSDGSSTTGETNDDDGDSDRHGKHHWRTGNANSAAHSARQAFFQTLQKFGITPQQFRQDLLLALKAALNGSSGDTTATDPLPPGSAVDVTT